MKLRFILSVGLILSCFAQPQNLLAETKTITIKVDAINSDGTPHKCHIKDSRPSTTIRPDPGPMLTSNPGGKDQPTAINGRPNPLTPSPNDATTAAIEKKAIEVCANEQMLGQTCAPPTPIFQMINGEWNPASYKKICSGTGQNDAAASVEINITCICSPNDTAQANKRILGSDAANINEQTLSDMFF